jgi:hypothetical protein
MKFVKHFNGGARYKIWEPLLYINVFIQGVHFKTQPKFHLVIPQYNKT